MVMVRICNVSIQWNKRAGQAGRYRITTYPMKSHNYTNNKTNTMPFQKSRTKYAYAVYEMKS